MSVRMVKIRIAIKAAPVPPPIWGDCPHVAVSQLLKAPEYMQNHDNLAALVTDGNRQDRNIGPGAISPPFTELVSRANAALKFAFPKWFARVLPGQAHQLLRLIEHAAMGAAIPPQITPGTP